MLTSGEIAQERAAERLTLTETATITTKTRTSDGAGGSTLGTTTQTGIPCKREPNMAGEGESDLGGQLWAGAQWIITFPALTTITAQDEVTIAGTVYAIMGVLGPETNEITRRVIATVRA